MTKYQKLLVYAMVLAGAVLLMPACSRSPMKAHYYIGFVNKTERDLDGVSAYYGDTKIAEPSRLVKGGKATEGLIPMMVPSEAEVRWDENSTHHAVKVKLEGVVPPGFDRFTIYFIIKADDSVDVKAIKLSDIDANANITK